MRAGRPSDRAMATKSALNSEQSASRVARVCAASALATDFHSSCLFFYILVVGREFRGGFKVGGKLGILHRQQNGLFRSGSPRGNRQHQLLRRFLFDSLIGSLKIVFDVIDWTSSFRSHSQHETT